MKKILFLLPLIICCVVFFTGCATQPTTTSYGPGFFGGLWHGITAPIALIGSIFLDIRIYEFPNSGGLYDLGFILGISCWGGGVAASRR